VAQLWKKCRQRRGETQLSNADNMAVVGILSTQVLDATFVRVPPSPPKAISLTTNIARSRGKP
jgi:asparagine synthase (glutamine-hydrolysing)